MQYGELCSIYVGRRPMIVLNTYEVVKEALVQKGSVYSGRPNMPLIEWITNGYGQYCWSADLFLFSIVAV